MRSTRSSGLMLNKSGQIERQPLEFKLTITHNRKEKYKNNIGIHKTASLY